VVWVACSYLCSRILKSHRLNPFGRLKLSFQRRGQKIVDGEATVRQGQRDAGCVRRSSAININAILDVYSIIGLSVSVRFDVEHPLGRVVRQIPEDPMIVGSARTEKAIVKAEWRQRNCRSSIEDEDEEEPIACLGRQPSALTGSCGFL
jgi:hypothetical protein